jgi:predicted metalloprotease with PDZ domain
MGSTGLEGTRDYAAVYWGGALVSLMADVEARRASAGELGLEDGLREVLRRGGQASKVWPLERVIRVVDSVLGQPVLARLSQRYASRGAPVDLPRLLSELGVNDTGDAIRLVPAPGAELRRQLVFPGRSSSSQRSSTSQR